MAERKQRATPPSLVLPEGTSFPLHVAKSFCVQNFSEIPFSCCTQPPSFCRVDRHIASDRCKPSPSSFWMPPAWFLWEVFAVWPALGTFFFHYCHVFEVHVLLSTARLKLLFVWYSALVFLTSEGVQKYSPPMDHGGQLKARLIQGRV